MSFPGHLLPDSSVHAVQIQPLRGTKVFSQSKNFQRPGSSCTLYILKCYILEGLGDVSSLAVFPLLFDRLCARRLVPPFLCGRRRNCPSSPTRFWCRLESSRTFPAPFPAPFPSSAVFPPLPFTVTVTPIASRFFQRSPRLKTCLCLPCIGSVTRTRLAIS